MWGQPAALAVEPTTSCNLRCPECPSGLRSFSRPTGMLQPDFFKRVVDQVKMDTGYLTFYFQGEPYLHPQFTEMVGYASKQGLVITTSTNAHYLNEQNARKTIDSGLDKLIISLDGITQETYSVYRVGGNLEKVIEGTRLLLRLRDELKSSTPYIVWQFLVVKPNEHEVEAAKLLATEVGVDEIVFKTAQLYDYENGNELMPMHEQYSRYRKGKDGKWHINNKLLNQCWKMWHSCVVTWDGTVVPCCFDKDAKHKLGDLHLVPLSAIWRDETYTNFRAAILRSRSEIDICANCSEGTAVWTTT
jgi:radical SAM protein with 4Fe4S-binding SPASM domain